LKVIWDAYRVHRVVRTVAHGLVDGIHPQCGALVFGRAQTATERETGTPCNEFLWNAISFENWMTLNPHLSVAHIFGVDSLLNGCMCGGQGYADLSWYVWPRTECFLVFKMQNNRNPNYNKKTT
jgi:hypothetical protein